MPRLVVLNNVLLQNEAQKFAFVVLSTGKSLLLFTFPHCLLRFFKELVEMVTPCSQN